MNHYTPKDIDTFIEQGYVILNANTDRVLPLVESFKLLRQDTAEVRRSWYRTLTDADDLGYTDYRLDPEYNPDGTPKDLNKCYLHFGVRLEEYLKEQCAVISNYHRPILQHGWNQFITYTDLYGGFIQDLQERLSCISLERCFRAQPSDQWGPLRLLHYDPKPDSLLAGKKHTDKSAISIHVAGQGCFRFYDNCGNTIDYEPEPGKIVIFASDKLQIATGGKRVAGNAEDDCENKRLEGGRIPALVHEPRFGTSAWSEHFAERFALVYFGHINVSHLNT